MASVSLNGLEEVQAMLLALGGELKTAGDKAQTRMAYQIREAAVAQMVGDLDRPTPFSLGGGLSQAGPRYKAAGKLPTATESSAGAPSIEGAAVYFRAPFGGPGLEPDEYLGVHVIGADSARLTAGPRASEKWLQMLGWMRPDQVWVPDKAVKLDNYGNVSGNTILAMMADIKPAGVAGDNFAPIGKPPDIRGVRARIGDGWYPFLWFVSRRSYSARYDFYGRADAEVQYGFKQILDDEITYALRKL